MIRLERVTYTYPAAAPPALREVNFEIADGAFVGVTGASGAGKSTLLAVLAGFIPHHFRGRLLGRVRVDDLDTAVTPLALLVRRVGFLFQNPFNQLTGARLTVAAEVAFGLENLGVPRPEMRTRVAAVLEQVGLTRLADRSPMSLSGGEMQRVALASILVMEPRILVLDEPTAQLDPAGAQQILSVIRDIAASRSCTVVMAGQRSDALARFADRVLVLRDGQVVADGSPRAVMCSPELEGDLVAPRYARAARLARDCGLWPREYELPVTLEQAVEGFGSR